MQRALPIAIIAYFILPAAGAAIFALDFRPDRLADLPVIVIFFLWIADGVFVLTAGIVLLGRLVRGAWPAREAVKPGALGLAGVILGLPPAFIALELVVKLVLFFQLVW